MNRLFVLLRAAIKRGALVTAANWQVVALQFLAETTFKILLGIPIVGGAVLVTLVLGADFGALLEGGLRQMLGLTASVLMSKPAALGMFAFSFLVMVIGGSLLMFLVKGGTVAVIVSGDAAAGPIERRPLRAATFRQAAQFGVDPFRCGCERLFRRYARLGLMLLAVYAISGLAYMLVIYNGYRLFGNRVLMGWTVVAAICSTLLIAWITAVNLLYLLTQMVIAIEDCSVRRASRLVLAFLRARTADVAMVFGAILVLVLLATLGSVIATAALGLIAFVPLAGLAVLPLQAGAWLLRGFIFQFLGLASLAAYVALYRNSLSMDNALGVHATDEARTA